jgi:hypothetical protein
MALVVLVVLALCGYGQLLRSGHVPYSPFSDNLAQNIARKHVLYQSLQGGTGVPLWRGDQLGGWPAMTEPQALYTYPFHALFWWMPPARALGPTFFLHMLLYAMVFFLLGGVLGLSWGPRLLMAVGALFHFKLIIALFAGWLPTIPGIVCVPLLMVVVFDALQRPRWQSAFWMALVGALCLHSGHLQAFYYMVLALFGLLLYRLFVPASEWKGKRPWALFGWLGAGACVAVCASAYLLVPLLLEASLTSRVQTDYASFLAGHAAQWKHLATLLSPEWSGTPLNGTYRPIELWEDVAYFGLVPLLLAVFGAIKGWKRPFVPYLALVCVLTLFVVPVDSPVLRACFSYVPGFRLFRSPNRMFFLASFCGLALAGVGAQEILQWCRGRDVSARLVVAGLALVLAVMATEGTWYARRYVTTAPVSKVLPKPAFVTFLRKQKGTFRVAALGRPTLNPGWAAPMGLSVVHGYEPYNYRHYQQYFGLMSTGRWSSRRGAVWADLNGLGRLDLFDMLGAAFLLSPARLSKAQRGPFVPVAQLAKQPMFLLYGGIRERPLFIYRNPGALPRAFWAKEVRKVASHGAVVRSMLRGPVRRVAIVTTGPTPPKPAIQKRIFQTKTPGTGIIWKQKTPDAFSLEVTTPARQSAFLMLGQTWHPGWQATCDGKPLAVHRTTLALTGVWVPPGKHTLAFRFRPLGWWWAWWGSVFAGLVLLGLGAWVAWAMRQRGRPSVQGEGREADA